MCFGCLFIVLDLMVNWLVGWPGLLVFLWCLVCYSLVLCLRLQFGLI